MAFSSSYSSEELISLFTTLAYVFMGIAILGLALAVFFFFYFDIPTVYITMTGKAKKDTIRKMEEENFKSGKLRYQYPATTGKTKRSGKLGKTDRTAEKHSNMSAPAVEPPQTYETGVLNVDAPETTALRGSQPEAIEPTTESGATVLLNTVDRGQFQAAQPLVDTQIRFHITENTMVIHTDEFI